MRSFACSHCGRLVFFENTQCLYCSTALGFVPDERSVVAARAVSHDASLRAVPRPNAGDAETFEDLLAEWLPLPYALNAVNRSTGSDDLYPFTLAQPVIEKLDFVHRRVRTATAAAAVAT